MPGRFRDFVGLRLDASQNRPSLYIWMADVQNFEVFAAWVATLAGIALWFNQQTQQAAALVRVRARRDRRR